MTDQLLGYYISQYGYVGVYLILAVSILGLPVPVEFLLTFVGYLTSTCELNPFLAIMAATMGSITGITAAYLLGLFFQIKVLSHLHRHAGKHKLEKVFRWYQEHGGRLLAAAYFIPVVRHLSGYVAGLSKMNYRYFAVFAYLGAVIWASLFVALGRILGSRWQVILSLIHRYALLLGLTAAILCILFYFASRKYGSFAKGRHVEDSILKIS
jgi:undecaprenyl-diphosphatase